MPIGGLSPFSNQTVHFHIMKDILEEIVAWKRQEIEEYKQVLPISQLQSMVMPLLDTPQSSMRKALTESATGIIAEFKRKSPSKGWIKQGGKANEIPLSYQQHGAAALSILTDSKYFGGYDEYIQQARAVGVTLPILYKNFVIDPYQLFLARHASASAVLLIAADLTLTECRDLMQLAHDLGLEVLLEMHSEQDLDYAVLEPDMYGINNRNLGTFITDVENSFQLAERLPHDGCKVSESGISKPATIISLREAGFNGFLMGECFMKEENPGEALADFLAALTHKA